MNYPDYLVHYNRNHDSKTGQFAPGDGDGDGVANDHANRKKGLTKGEKVAIGVGAGAVTAGTIASTAIILGSILSTGKTFANSNSDYELNNIGFGTFNPSDWKNKDYATSLQKQFDYNAKSIIDQMRKDSGRTY